jgi:hypothetical protein
MKAQTKIQKKRVGILIISLFLLVSLSSFVYGEWDSAAAAPGGWLQDSGPFSFLDVINMDAKGNLLIWDPRNERVVKLNHVDGSIIWGAGCNVGSSPYIDNAIDSKGNIVIGGTFFDDAHHFLRKYDGKNGVLLWEVVTPMYNSSASPQIYLDHSGNVFSTGTDGATNYIAKYNANSGAVVWKQNRGPLETRILGVDPGCNVTAYDLDPTNHLCYVSKYDGRNGAVIWENTQQAYLGDVPYERMAIDVHFDGRRNLYLTGANLPDGSTRFISKHNGTTGALIWQKSVLGDTIDFDSHGNVVVFHNVNDRTLSITRYNGSTGKVMWESTHGIFSFGNFKHMFDPKGNVIVVGSANDTAVSITKYHGATGHILWDIIPTFTTNRDHVMLDSAGDLIIESTGGGDTESLAKYKGSTGILLWEKTLAATGSQAYAGAGLDLEGNVLVRRQVNGTTAFITKYNGSTGGLMWDATHSGSQIDIDFDKNGSVLVIGFSDGFIAKNDTSSGDLIWEKTFWSPEPSPIPE